MKKVVLTMIGLLLLVLALSGISYGWQGRMGGMGDPYGLVQDESDFLINPADIAQGQGVRFYGDYRFTYTGVTNWDYNLDQFDTAGNLIDFFNFDTSGQEYKHDALLGAAFPVWLGRMGLFFTYDGMRGDYDGSEDVLGAKNFAEYNLTKKFDNFAVRLLYGLPVGGGVDVGAEVGLAYRNEVQKSWWNQTDMSVGTQNYIWSWNVPERNLFPFMIPYDSSYLEALWKTGVKLNLLKAIIEVNLRGGAIVTKGSDNTYRYLYGAPVGANDYNVNINGNVTGWHIGSDIWARVPGGNPTVTFPVLVSLDYAEKKRDGGAVGTGTLDTGALYGYTHKEQSWDLKAGGGIEKKLSGNALIAGGIYYNYLQGRDDISITRDATTRDNSEFPSRQEHKAILRLAGEKELSPTVTLRMGLNSFFGWINEEFEFNDNGAQTDNISLDGFHWGIGASLGGTFKIPSIHITLEPFINGGWQQYNLDGDGDRTGGSLPTLLWEMDKSRSEWSLGGGLSILYDL